MERPDVNFDARIRCVWNLRSRTNSESRTRRVFTHWQILAINSESGTFDPASVVEEEAESDVGAAPPPSARDGPDSKAAWPSEAASGSTASTKAMYPNPGVEEGEGKAARKSCSSELETGTPIPASAWMTHLGSMTPSEYRSKSRKRGRTRILRWWTRCRIWPSLDSNASSASSCVTTGEGEDVTGAWPGGDLRASRKAW